MSNRAHRATGGHTLGYEPARDALAVDRRDGGLTITIPMAARYARQQTWLLVFVMAAFFGLAAAVQIGLLGADAESELTGTAIAVGAGAVVCVAFHWLPRATLVIEWDGRQLTVSQGSPAFKKHRTSRWPAGNLPEVRMTVQRRQFAVLRFRSAGGKDVEFHTGYDATAVRDALSTLADAMTSDAVFPARIDGRDTPA